MSEVKSSINVLDATLQRGNMTITITDNLDPEKLLECIEGNMYLNISGEIKFTYQGEDNIISFTVVPLPESTYYGYLNRVFEIDKYVIEVEVRAKIDEDMEVTTSLWYNKKNYLNNIEADLVFDNESANIDM